MLSEVEYNYNSIVDTICLNLSTIEHVPQVSIDLDWAAHGLRSPVEIYKKINSIIEYIILGNRLPLEDTYICCSDYVYSLLLCNDLIKYSDLDKRKFVLKRNVEQSSDSSIYGFILNGIDVFERLNPGSFLSEEKVKQYYNLFGPEYDTILFSMYDRLSTILGNTESTETNYISRIGNYDAHNSIFILTYKSIQHAIQLRNTYSSTL